MVNLFDKKNAKKTTAKAEKVEVQIKEPKFHMDLGRLAQVTKEIDELSAEAAVLHGEIKDRGITEFQKLYQATDRYPGSFMVKASGLKGAAPASYMFIPTDRYLKIDEDRASELQNEFGESIVEETTTYTMDAKLIEKYGAIISELIGKCKAISDDDKGNLISIATSYAVKKGTISELHKYEGTIPEILEEIKPIYQIKNIKIEE
jgi:hypothetical protein